jgi:large subunit ribosomal protein L30
MARIKITQTRSIIGCLKNQKLTMKALGIKRNGKSVEHNDTSVIRGMINVVRHLVHVEDVK